MDQSLSCRARPADYGQGRVRPHQEAARGVGAASEASRRPTKGHDQGQDAKRRIVARRLHPQCVAAWPWNTICQAAAAWLLCRNMPRYPDNRCPGGLVKGAPRRPALARRHLHPRSQQRKCSETATAFSATLPRRTETRATESAAKSCIQPTNRSGSGIRLFGLIRRRACGGCIRYSRGSTCTAFVANQCRARLRASRDRQDSTSKPTRRPRTAARPFDEPRRGAHADKVLAVPFKASSPKLSPPGRLSPTTEKLLGVGLFRPSICNRRSGLLVPRQHE